MLTRIGLHSLSDLRFREAEYLLSGGYFAGAYYVGGYAAELGLKACIAKLFKADAIPDFRKFVDIRTHNLDDLIVYAELKSRLDAQIKANETFETNWELVLKWRPDSRYEVIDEVDARNLLDALRDPTNGVLEWIRTHW